jgi:hypothetical protein
MTVTSRAVVSPHVVNIDDLRDLARRRVPRIVFDYIDGGANGEIIWKVSLYFYAAMFFVAAISWLFVVRSESLCTRTQRHKLLPKDPRRQVQSQP